MIWRQVLKNAVIVAIGAPIAYWVLVQILGGGESTTIRTYIIVAIASAIGSATGEILRHRTRRK